MATKKPDLLVGIDVGMTCTGKHDPYQISKDAEMKE
jgi:hypothetical protein